MFAQPHNPPAFLQKSGKVYEKIIQIARETRIMPRFLVEAGIAVIASIYGSSSLDVCHSLWGDVARLSYKLREQGIIVWQGGGAGVMEAARYGSDAHSVGLSLDFLETVIEAKCKEKTASSQEKIEIEKHITSYYTTPNLEGSYSLHGACWLSRMAKMSYIGTGAWRSELYSIYSVLDIMSTQSNILIDIESPVTSYGTDLETAAADAQIGYKPYLSPDKSQIIIHYGPNGLMPKRREQAHVVYAQTLNQLMESMRDFVATKICVANKALSACKNSFYSPIASDAKPLEHIVRLK